MTSPNCSIMPDGKICNILTEIEHDIKYEWQGEDGFSD